MEGLMLGRWVMVILLFNGLRRGFTEKQSRGMFRPPEAMAWATWWVYIHVSWSPSSSGCSPSNPLSLLSSLHHHTTSLPSVVSYQTDGFIHMAFCITPSSHCPLRLCLPPPSLSLHHPNALWQCRPLCLLLHGSLKWSVNQLFLFVSLTFTLFLFHPSFILCFHWFCHVGA